MQDAEKKAALIIAMIWSFRLVGCLAGWSVIHFQVSIAHVIVLLDYLALEVIVGVSVRNIVVFNFHVGISQERKGLCSNYTKVYSISSTATQFTPTNHDR